MVLFMKEFEFFLSKGDVKTATIDMNLSMSLKESSKERLDAAMSLPVNDKMSKMIFENSYEALMEAADAILTLRGYKSYSHEASIAFLLKKKILEESRINILDAMRKKRNRMKYYGRKSNSEEAKDALSFAKKVLPILIGNIK